MANLKKLSALVIFVSLAIVGSSAVGGQSWACTGDGKEGILPENDLRRPVGFKDTSMTEAQFNRVIDEVVRVMRPLVAAKGGNLVVNKRWNDPKVNAYATQSGRNFSINMFGGLARHETITADGFASVVCHEIGHHIGGAPKKTELAIRWGSNEGQADYWAMLKCMRLVYGGNDSPRPWVRPANVPSAVTQGCRATFRFADDIELCERTALAGLSLANLFASVRSRATAPSFTSRDANVVSSMYHDHPEPQCRLDTYFAGSLCGKDVSEDVSDSDVTQGTCSSERGDTIGVRPRCWYKPAR